MHLVVRVLCSVTLNINWLVFITETECVYWVVRTEPLNKIRVNLSSPVG
jgi:hypothetical protein